MLARGTSEPRFQGTQVGKLSSSLDQQSTCGKS